MAASPSTTVEDAIEVTWLPPDVPVALGYRILRSTTSGGPYELVGETLEPAFTDAHVHRGDTYYYVVQAYDAAGILSDYSAEASASVPLRTTFIPVVTR